jgi:peptidoglycan/xylan/chitin deacetylase (PgdA/CDA1 family)
MTYPVPPEAQQAEPGRYWFNPWRDRPKITWPGGKRLAFWVAPNVEFYELNPPRGPARASWFRPEPDVLHYGIRDYGNRVGFWRMAGMFDELGVTASISLNVAVLDHFPEIGRAMADRGWELFSHGVYNTRYHYGMSADQERALIRDVAATIHRVSGQRLSGWLSPALTNTPDTLDILAEEGVEYTLDLFHDDQPQPVRVRNGRLVSLPYSLQVNDWTGLHTGAASPRQYARMIREQFLRLYAEGAASGTVMALPLHPWMIGYPHRADPLAEVIAFILGHEGVWHATGREITAHYLANYHDADKARLTEADNGR